MSCPSEWACRRVGRCAGRREAGRRGGTHLDQILARHAQVKGIPVLELAAHLLQQSLWGGQATARGLRQAVSPVCQHHWLVLVVGLASPRQVQRRMPAGMLAKASNSCVLARSKRLACSMSEGMGLPAGSSPPR